NRKVDVALTATPVPETAIHRGFALMFIDNAKGEDPSFPEFLMVNLITRPEVIEKNPDLVRRMTRALVKANKWAHAAPVEQVAEALRPTFARTEPAIHVAGVKAVLPALNADGRTTARSFQVTQDVLEQAGLLKRRVPFADVVNNDFVPR
ncbi:MAG: ABC transporter substrate-binding protein, partial [Candidatus Rokubacteria bacterium]|nr:ABC transporter substrate-binding protein [Candidatus Rokubacteria bacterium]